MPLPIPTIGSTDVHAVVIDAAWNRSLDTVLGQTFECLESLYGNQNPDGFNPLIFSSVVPTCLPYGTEVLFDVVAAPWDATVGVATNVRAV